MFTLEGADMDKLIDEKMLRSILTVVTVDMRRCAEEDIRTLVQSAITEYESRRAGGQQIPAEDLLERINHAVSLLEEAALSEDFDPDACLDEARQLKDLSQRLGKTTDRAMLERWYDQLCEALGVSNDDEHDAFGMALKAIRQQISAQGECVSVPSEPTGAMIEAGRRMMDTLVGDNPKLVYKAMLAAGGVCGNDKLK